MIDLVCPKCRRSINISEKEALCDNCKTSYKIIDNVPVFTTTPIESNLMDNYLEHYAIDGKEFDYYKKGDKQLDYDDHRMHQFIFGKINRKTKCILDVGAGSNWVAAMAIPKGIKVCAVDISLRNIQQAMNKFDNVSYTGIVADAFSLPFKAETFDCIIASEIIEHVVDPSRFVSTLFKLLKPGGRLIISTPYKEKIQQHLCIHCNKPTPSNAHLHSFDKQKIKNLYHDNDLVRIKTFTYSNKLLSLIRCHIILKLFPYILWRSIDRIFNFLIPKPARLLAVFYKKTQ